MTKRCSKCGIEKPSGEFHRNKSEASGLKCACKPCANAEGARYYAANREKVRARSAARYSAAPEKAKARQAKYYAANIEKINAKQAIYRATNPEKVKASQLMSVYGLSPEDFQKMCLMQKNVCGICKENFSKTPYVDHCHKTGKIRGLLCQACNTMLGGSKDSPTNLRRAAEYLEKTSCVEEANVVKE